MTKFIVLPDVHDKSESLKRIARPLYEADCAILAGDITNGKISHLHRVLSILEYHVEEVYAVLGNMDTPPMLNLFSREGQSLHRRHQLIDGVAFCGVGGALPFAGKYVFNEAEFARLLEDTQEGIPPNTPQILICHQPPYGTLCDTLPTGEHVGSHSVRAFIERVQPMACYCGHIHEAVSVDAIGKTKIINPGPFWQSNAYAYGEIKDGQLVDAGIRPIETSYLGRKQ